MPKVYDNLEDCYSYARMMNVDKYGQKAPYRIEVVQITPEVVWEGIDDTVQPADMGSTISTDG
jgi:hypothetical protein